MKISFQQTSSDGNVSVMDTSGLNISEIRFDRETREISLVASTNRYTEESLEGLSWQAIKKLVEDNGGTWENTAAGKEFLIRG